ncbi:Protein insensitive [Eumeta japonica]|uniref:Protein insensitive n=1 Tax=Eumeta variegata TaxID=151549 RepID=A0A4C1YN14_EUMVA|nr:Protein insensitive [Eumeta japonica]
MTTRLDILIWALEAACEDSEDVQDHGVPRPASTQAPPREALHPASAAVASDCSGETRAAKVVAPSGDRKSSSLAKNGQNSRVNSETTNDPEPGDYSSSGSSWAPDQQSSSDSESELTDKCTKRKRMKQLKPFPRPEPVSPRCSTPSRFRQKILERLAQGTDTKNSDDSKLLHKCSLLNKSVEREKVHIKRSKMVSIDPSELNAIKTEMEVIRKTVQELKMLSNNLMEKLSSAKEEDEPSQDTPVSPGPTHDKNINSSDKAEGTKYTSTRWEVESKRKKESVTRSTKSSSKVNTSVRSELKEMVPIGTGITLVPKEVYSKINWKSYTMATRKLLMAVFSRRTLATHSLTGKASPAFLSKPAKLCLDPEKVADIVMTVTANCHVKGSLVRSAITTKCADENKMLKLQMQKKQRQRTLEASAADKDLQEGAAAEVTSE